MNPNLNKLQSYPFEKLAKLKGRAGEPADKSHISLSIGEPQHPTPRIITESLMAHMHTLTRYPTTRGMPELREAIASWLCWRFKLSTQNIDPDACIIPVNGTREALFAFAQSVVDPATSPLILMPNPFYQIYEGAALLAGAEPYFLNCTAETNYLPDFDSVPDVVWRQCQLIYICSPGNPTGEVIDAGTLEKLIDTAEKFDFVIAADECYSELYDDESNPPPGLLQVCQSIGNDNFRRCVVFHSLSKRSNAPGLRSGFVAGDAELLKHFLLYRTYHGCAMAPPTQYASISAWQDEKHVVQNRKDYRAKFSAVLDILGNQWGIARPEAGFYLWPQTPIDDTEFALKLYEGENITVLPGSFLSRDSGAVNPGKNHIRIALVAPLDECIEAAHRLKSFVTSF
ncbi:MAG: succinyldiaminopimelate transaminase [Methylococcales bacterium]